MRKIQTRRHPRWLLFGFWFSVAIAIGAVVRRFFALIYPTRGGPPAMAELDAAFSSHALLTLLHIAPAAAFVALAAAVLLHRDDGKWVQRFFFLFGAITGATAYAMSAFAVGGWIERSAVLVFDSWFLFSLARAYWYDMRGERMRKREWMTRAVAILLGIATTRPVMGVFFATSARTHLGPHDFFGIAFWIGFSANAVAVEMWLRSGRRQQTQ